MKNKLLVFFIAIALCAAIQLNMSMASENQGWYDWAKSKWNEFTSTRQTKLIQEKAKYFLPAALVGGKTAAYTLTQAIPKNVSAMTLKTIERGNFQIVLYSGISLAVLATTIYSIITYYKTGSWSRTDAVIQIKNTLTIVLNNQLLYPTRSSKLNALLKKDEFPQYITDEYGLVREACAELSKEISTMPYSDDQRIVDRIIDAKINEIRNMFNQYPTLNEQIKELEKYCKEKIGFDISEMQACLSLYFRLKNKQEVESKLPLEEKISRQLKKEELIKAKRPTLTSPVFD